jgi:hypothetical protein
MDVYSVISLKQRSTCRHVSYFDTDTYVILCHKQQLEEMTEERKTKIKNTNECLCYPLTIYMRGGEYYILIGGDVQSLYDIHMFRAS